MNPVLAFIGMPGPMELFIILGVMVLLFGKRLPKLAFDLGNSFTQFKAGLSEPIGELREELERETKDAERTLNKEVRDIERAVNEAS